LFKPFSPGQGWSRLVSFGMLVCHRCVIVIWLGLPDLTGFEGLPMRRVWLRKRSFGPGSVHLRPGKFAEVGTNSGTKFAALLGRADIYARAVDRARHGRLRRSGSGHLGERTSGRGSEDRRQQHAVKTDETFYVAYRQSVFALAFRLVRSYGFVCVWLLFVVDQWRLGWWPAASCPRNVWARLAPSGCMKGSARTSR
jgi:hypothetical protein